MTKVYRTRKLYALMGINNLIILDMSIIFAKENNIFSGNVSTDGLALKTILFSISWVIFLSASLWIILTYIRWKFIISENQIVNRVNRSQHSLLIEDITEIIWYKQYPDGGVIVQTKQKYINLNLFFYSKRNTYEIVSFLRKLIPFDQQQNWDSYIKNQKGFEDEEI